MEFCHIQVTGEYLRFHQNVQHPNLQYIFSGSIHGILVPLYHEVKGGVVVWYFDMHRCSRSDGKLVSLSVIMVWPDSQINLAKPTLQSHRLPFCNF